jgi:serine/threonine protein kinase
MSSTATSKHPVRIGRYTVTGLIGRGGMGTVYRGHDDALDRDVAVKVIHDRFGHSENVLRRFGEEAKNVARLSSPHIVHVHEFDPLATPPFLAMELVRGPSLQQLIRGRGRASFATVIDCGRQVLAGLATAHSAGVVHRDIKPANVLRGPDGTYKLTDFGLARSLEREQSLTATGSIIGTLHYMAPEVAAGEEATASSDLYSVGVTLYEMLTGTTPFPEESPLKLLRRIAAERPLPVTAHRDGIPPQLEAWLAKLLAHDPASRFPSAAAALDALRQVEIPTVADDDYATLHFEAEACDANAPTAATPRLDGQSPEPIHREQVDSIIRSALRLEAQGRSLLGDDTVLEIARELHVDSRFVRRALADHRAANAPPLAPWPPAPHGGPALLVDPTDREACADAIDRLWWGNVVGMLPAIPTFGPPVATLNLQPVLSATVNPCIDVFGIIGCGLERNALRGILSRHSRVLATAAGVIGLLLCVEIGSTICNLLSLGIPSIGIVAGVFAIAGLVLSVVAYWKTLSGTADLLDRGCNPTAAAAVRRTRTWGLVTWPIMVIVAAIVGDVVEKSWTPRSIPVQQTTQSVSGGTITMTLPQSSASDRALGSIAGSIARYPINLLWLWLFVLRPLALASRTLRGPFAAATAVPFVAVPAYAARDPIPASRVEPRRVGESLVANATCWVVGLGMTIGGWMGFFAACDNLGRINGLGFAAGLAASLCSVLIGGAALGHRRPQPWKYGLLNVCSPLGSALALVLCLFPGRPDR